MLKRFPRSIISACISSSVLFLLIGAITILAGARSPVEASPEKSTTYKVLAPLESGNLTIFPVVRTNATKSFGWSYITLDEGLASGQVVVTEAGRAQGLVRNRQFPGLPEIYNRDRVNQLVLFNNSTKPLLLLAGEIVTGGKQDRVIAKDRIVPPQSEPMNLSVFCIEPGRWVTTSEQFGVAGRTDKAFMAQPAVRQRAMLTQDQQQVWDAVGTAISGLSSSGGFIAGSPAPRGGIVERAPLEKSYAKAMQQVAVEQKVDEAGQKLLQSREQILAKLRQEHAVGVIAAVRGELVWADIFSDPDMLGKYWTKLIRSYAAEALTAFPRSEHAATVEEAQHFLDAASAGHETSSGETGIYRYTEIRSGDVTSFVLHSLLPETDFDVHTSKAKSDPRPIVHPGVILR